MRALVVFLALVAAAPSVAHAQASAPPSYPGTCPPPMIDGGQNCVQHTWTNNGTAINPAQGERYLGEEALFGTVKTRFINYIATYFGVTIDVVNVYGTNSLTFSHSQSRLHAVAWISTRWGVSPWFSGALYSGVSCLVSGDIGGADTAKNLSLVEHGIAYGGCVQYNRNYSTGAWVILGAPAL